MKTVLLYGDYSRMSSVFAHTSKTDDYIVEIASTLSQAENYIYTTKVDVIVIDLEFSQGDGLSFLKKYRALPIAQQTAKIIAMSRHDSDERIQKIFKLGVYKYLLMGVTSPARLARTIRHVIESTYTWENA